MNSVIGRGLALGAAAGAVVGAIAGTVVAEVLGTMFGALAGAMWGGVYGTVGGLALTLVRRLGGGRGWARAVAAVTSASCAVLTESAYVGFTTKHRPTAIVFALVCIVVGALLGPATMLGLQPHVVGRRRRPWQDAAGRLLVTLLLVCAGAGAVTGLVLGMRVYVPTAPVAAVEGAVLGSGAGLVLWALAVLVLFAPRLRTNR